MIKNNTIAAELARADEGYLTALANKGLYKRALKDAEGGTPIFFEYDDRIEMSIGQESCVIKAPLDSSECTCPARGVCRHILAAALLLKMQIDPNTVPAADEAPMEQKEQPRNEPAGEQPQPDKPIPKKELAKVRETASICLSQMAGLLKQGLVRASDSADDGFEIAAVRCHAAKMANAERAVRELGSRLNDFTLRRAAFDERTFMHRLCEGAAQLSSLCEGEPSPSQLGSFKKTYEDYKGTLDILPIGTRSITEGDYKGAVYYFLNLDESKEQRFLSYADLRPDFYDSVGSFKRGSPEIWGAGVHLKRLMKSRMSLVNAKLSGGSLSSSSKTVIAAQSKANLNCSEFRRLVYNDLREIAIDLSKRKTQDETSQLFLFHPESLLCWEFDDNTQSFEAQLRDEGGNIARLLAKYTANTRELIEQLEAHARHMTDHPDGYFVWLVSAYFEDGELILFPIEMYDFIIPLEQRDFTLPPEYEGIDRQAHYADRLGELFDEIEAKLCDAVRSGIGASLTDTDKLLQLTRDYGLASLYTFLEGFFRSAESHRHSMQDKSLEALLSMSRVYAYISLARERLALILALYNMRG